MPPKGKSRQKKQSRNSKSEPDGKNSPSTAKSEGGLRVAEFPADYTHSLINGIIWDTLGGIPCFTCTNVKRCGVRQPISPVTCSAINAWLNYESLPPEERTLPTPDFWTKTEEKKKIKLESIKT